MSDPRSTRRRPLSGLGKFALLAGAIVFAGLAVEGAVRLRHYFKHGSFTPIYDFVVDEASGLRIPRPGTHGRIVCDAQGFRSPELVSPKPQDTVRIAFLGASTTFCAEASDNDATWPALVVDGIRRQQPDHSFDWINAAAAGFTVEQSARNLAARVAPHRPDVIVIYHATNDLTQDTRALAAAADLWHDDDRPSWLERHSMAWEVLTKNLALFGHSKAAAADATARIDFDAASLASSFGDRLEALVRASQAAADVVVLVTFSHRVRPEQDADARREACQSASYYMPFLEPDAILAGIAAYNDAIRTVAARTGVVLIDDEHAIPADDEHFNDSVHLRDAGCRKQAERILAVLGRAGVLDPAWR